jgi:predicted cobalt transporter CbtA
VAPATRKRLGPYLLDEHNKGVGHFSFDCGARLIAGAAIVLVIVIVQNVLPEINEVPEQISAVVLWRFRVAALGIQVVLWTTIGLLFGVLTERSFAERFGQRLSVGADRL